MSRAGAVCCSLASRRSELFTMPRAPPKCSSLRHADFRFFHARREIIQVDKDASGKVTKSSLMGVRYVPLCDEAEQRGGRF